MNKYILGIILILLMASFVWAEDWLTIYNDDLSLVRSNFELELKQGKQDYNYTDITSRIEAPSVIVLSRDGSVRVTEQNYEFDLAGKAQILNKYIDKKVDLFTKDNSHLTGVLKFYDGASFGLIEEGTNRLILADNDQVQLIQLAELPPNFYTRPTLHWNLLANKAGKHQLQLMYLTGGLGWDVTYNSIWDGHTLALNSWVTITNNSGKAFNNVHLKLIAGDVNRVRKDYYDMAGRGYEVMLKTAEQAAPTFEEKAFHDFHMYTLDQPVTFADKQTKQMELYPQQNVNATQIYEYNTFDNRVLSIIKFKNTEENGIGKPLPKGTIKVYKKDVDNNLEFIGEDSINHTSKNEEVRIKTGTAFDLVGKTIIKDQKTISQKVSQRTIQVTLRNNSAENKTINLLHYLGPNAKILSVENAPQPSVDEYNKATFEINIAPNQEIILSFLERTEY